MLQSLSIFAGTGLGDTVLWGLIIASYFTSALTAAFGIGGGIALLAILGLTIPVTILIPLHGMVQLGSNAGRAWHLRNAIRWPFLTSFMLGAMLGTIAGSQIVVTLSDHLLKIILSLFLLILIWAPRPKSFKGGRTTILLGGVLSSLAGMFVGATGPIVAAMVAKHADDRQGVVSTHAAAMVLQHGLKVLAFGIIGFAFHQWLALIAAMIASGYLGTITGAKLLHRMDEKFFRKVFRLLLTTLALIMLYTGMKGTWI